MPFLFFPEKRSGPQRPLAQGGPLIYGSSDLTLDDRGKLVQIINNRVLLCPDGSYPDGILERVESPCGGNLAGVQMNETVWDFPIIIFDNDDPPKSGEYLIVGAHEGRAVEVLPASDIFPNFHLLDVDAVRKICCFRFPGKFLFAGKSIIFA